MPSAFPRVGEAENATVETSKTPERVGDRFPNIRRSRKERKFEKYSGNVANPHQLDVQVLPMLPEQIVRASYQVMWRRMCREDVMCL
ncbi:hypothetical protein Pmani_000351 [Petrolisthes manimaculis]|uniref:Uncharacterized protein n=1 Tax=Petrolisthes manimaculis TaxID=1843537 RepID=A0AAE1QQ53_9EUCA|nr:hypothetical protein Pmani_000351 [Petrolisthes manimaculis]